MDDSDTLSNDLNLLLHKFGFECYPFKMGWYNQTVKPIFRFPHDSDTLCFVIINAPDMFEKAFLPFVSQHPLNDLNDPIDQCMVYHLSQIKEAFPDLDVEIIHEYELMPNRRPKILAQTACHVSGAAHYYQCSDVNSPTWPESQKIYGVCVHPKYGGWFAIRAMVIFKGVRAPNLIRRHPIDVVPNEEDRIKLLEQFNLHWEDWTYRDIIPVKTKYSEQQKLYFGTKPKDRMALVCKLYHDQLIPS